MNCRFELLPSLSPVSIHKISLVVFLILILISVSSAFSEQDYVRLYLFWQEGCPMCERMKPFLEELEAAHSRLKIMAEEVGHTLAGIRGFQQAAVKFGIETPNVPAVFLGARAWIGYSETITAEIAGAVEGCLENGCIDAMKDPLPEKQVSDGTQIKTRLFGTIDLGTLPLALSTVLIAVLDGVNPCSLWVLTFLLGMVMHTGSWKNVLLVGTVFLLTTSVIYGLFIIGVVQVLSVLSFAKWIRYGVALLAFAMGAINVKDFFAFKKGVSLTISDQNRRRIGTRARSLIGGNRSTFSLLTSTVLLAAGIAVIELPCTAGFPIIWSNLVSMAQAPVPVFVVLLALYLVVYIADESIIVGVAALSFRRISMDEKRGRYLKLLGGAVMIALAAVMIVHPELMESIWSVIAIFASAICLTLLVVLLKRFVRRTRRTNIIDYKGGNDE